MPGYAWQAGCLAALGLPAWAKAMESQHASGHAADRSLRMRIRSQWS